MGKWNNGCTCLGQGEGLAKIPLDREVNKSVNSLFKSTFQYSTIPFGLHETCSITNIVISISCTNSETLDYGSALSDARPGLRLVGPTPRRARSFWNIVWLPHYFTAEVHLLMSYKAGPGHKGLADENRLPRILSGGSLDFF
jgi:hypothetical protein